MLDLLERRAPLAEVAAWLDDRPHDARVAATRALGRRHQRALWALAAAAEPLTLDQFATEPLVPVAHVGWNSLPLPAPGRRFVKWMTRQPDGLVVGYNASPLRPLLGPGYFVLRDTTGAEQADGAVIVDYHLRVRRPVPDAWPRPLPNWVGPQVLVYFHTRDVMRRVSRHVTIGAATKYGFHLGSWFVLVRRDD